ncbi:MAG: sigma-70 family RNA polymerase sigma factor [Bacteroidales bacterium]|jgi:RNA polymerase sigma-70 factor (ECF subfamily)
MTLTTEEPIDFLFDKYFSLLVLYAKRFVNSYAVAEDIVQETFLKLWEKESSRLYNKAFLFTCVHNRAVNYRRRNKSSIEINEGQKNGQFKDGQFAVSSEIEANEDVIEEYERLRALFKALDKLPPKTLEVLNSVYLEGKNYQLVADEMGLSINTVKAHMYLAFKLLRKYLLVFVLFMLELYWIVRGIS